ncbi:MAG: hypothetical protein QXX08_04700 [Candidatus Bathyarchaeia archaeon]
MVTKLQSLGRIFDYAIAMVKLVGSSKANRKKRLTVPNRIIVTNIETLPTRIVPRRHGHRPKRSPWFGRHSGGHGRRPTTISWGESQFSCNMVYPAEVRRKKKTYKKATGPA